MNSDIEFLLRSVTFQHATSEDSLLLQHCRCSVTNTPVTKIQPRQMVYMHVPRGLINKLVDIYGPHLIVPIDDCIFAQLLCQYSKKNQTYFFRIPPLDEEYLLHTKKARSETLACVRADIQGWTTPLPSSIYPPNTTWLVGHSDGTYTTLDKADGVVTRTLQDHTKALREGIINFNSRLLGMIMTPTEHEGVEKWLQDDAPLSYAASPPKTCRYYEISLAILAPFLSS